MTAYPGAPWRLRGQMYLSVFLVPPAQLPPLPAALRGTVRPVTVAGRAVAGVAWVRYEPGGDLSYRELLSAVLVHERGRPRVTIVGIWVDDVRSRDGGRALWGIPKDLARLHIDADATGTVRARAGSGTAIADADVRPRRWPGRWPLGLTVVQELDDRVRRTPVRGRAGLAPAAATWRADPDGPLGYLAGRRPVLSCAVGDFRLRFGAAGS